MKCPRCEFENRESVLFCEGCGAKLEQPCPACGTAVRLDRRFCGACGHALTGAAPPAAKFASPHAYTPKHLAERILTRSALEGERKQVTVLFADLKGSMELLADRDPEEARKLLDPVLELMMEAVHRYEGTVNQVMGDGIMALFGAPLAHEDHAVRACYASLRMQEAVKRYAEEVFHSQGVAVEIRVGLNSGEVVVRSVGSDLRMDYTAVGQTTHLAARMEQLASPGSTLLTSHTLDLAEGYVEVKLRGSVPVKGLTDPVEVFEVTGAGPVRRRFEASALRGLTRFVGREAELDQLLKALDLAAQAHGQIVAMVGEPGVGKSRLFFEFTHSHRTQGWLILETGSVSYGKATTYLPVIDLLKAYFQIESRDEARKVREKVSGKLVTLDETLLPALPVFLALLDVPVEDPQWQALDPSQRRQRTLEAVKRLLLRESQVQPLVLVVEDLHWIDSETQAVLDSLVESLPTARVLLLVNYRPEYQHGWSSKSYYRQLQLHPLPPESAQEVLAVLLGSDPGLARLKGLLIERTEGNPFFLEESVRTLVETKALTGERGAYRLAKPVDTTQVPVTVQAILAARIDRLPPEEKRLLQSAAVIGHEVAFVLLQAIAELPDEELRQGLAHLQAAEFLYETRLFPDLEYMFKHALTHEVAHGSLLQDRRSALHARIVEALERLYPDRLAEHVERLAHHAFRSEMWDKALRYLHQAGGKAASRSAHQDAVAYFEQALRALTHLPESRDTLGRDIDLRFALRTSLTPLGEHQKIANYLREAESLAKSLADPHRLGRVSAYTSDYLRLIGDHERAIESGRRALTIAETVNDLSLQAMATSFLGLAYYARGDYRMAVQFFRQNMGSPAGKVSREQLETAWLPTIHSRAWLASCLAELGDFSEGIEEAGEAIRIAESANHAPSLCVAYFGVGQLCLRKGDLTTAISHLERGLELSRTWTFWLALPNIAAALGLAYALAGHIAEALPLLGEAVEQSASMKRMGLHSIRVGSLSEGYLLAGRLNDAIELAQRSLELSRYYKERGCEAWALRLLGEIELNYERFDAEKVEALYDQAMLLADDLGMRPLLAQCHLGLGRLHRKKNNPARARQHLVSATTLFHEMGMAFWLGKSEAELKD